MNQLMTSLVVGIAALLCAAIFSVAHYPRAHKDEPVARWLDTHPLREWMRHKG
jgi:hypothetical protein